MAADRGSASAGCFLLLGAGLGLGLGGLAALVGGGHFGLKVGLVFGR